MQMTDSCHCFRSLPFVLLVVLLTVLPLPGIAQRTVWSLPQHNETVRTGSVAIGNASARDTYLSASSYDGWELGFEHDSWRGFRPDRLFNTGRVHSSLLFSPMTNRLNGGMTYQFAGSVYMAGLWQAVDCSMCDLLVGPAAMMNLSVLWNLQNSNNPANGDGYLAAGVCVDNTFRFSLARYPMALQATFYMPLAGVGIAPDYDLPYWFVYRYGEYGKVLHFITPFNNTAFTQQVALILPVHNARLRIGYSLDFMENRLGGHYSRLLNGAFTLGYAVRLQTKEWRR